MYDLAHSAATPAARRKCNSRCSCAQLTNKPLRLQTEPSTVDKVKAGAADAANAAADK